MMPRKKICRTSVVRAAPVKPDMPGLRGPEVERLYRRGAAWLAGEPVSR